MSHPHVPAVATTKKRPHPFVWTILYLPFGALGGFVGVAMTFGADLPVAEASLLNAAQLLTSWMKWAWAPLVDVTLTPKAWYVIATVCSALGVLLMSAIPTNEDTLGIVLIVIAIASLINSMVGMSIEAMLSANSDPSDHGRVSAWFQAGNLGGAGLGGGLGLFLMNNAPAPWFAGAVLGVLFLCCCTGLYFVEDVAPDPNKSLVTSIANVFVDLKGMVSTRGGLLAAFLCTLPVGTGAVQGTLTQEAIAKHWGAGELEVTLIQGLFAAFVTTAGCFAGGWLCDRMHPQRAYAAIGLLLAAIAVAMALAPANVPTYVIGNLTYSFGVGLAYSAFTAVALNAMGDGSGATKYNVFASLSNFPIWWLGIVLGQVASRYGDLGGPAALIGEALLGVLGVGLFIAATRAIQYTSLPDAPAKGH